MNVRLHSTSLLMVLLLLSLSASAQQVRRTRRVVPDSIDTKKSVRRGPYTIVATAGSGVSYYATRVLIPDALDQGRLSRFGVPASFRVMWYPDHRLRVGLESGWVPMYSYRGRIAGDPARVTVSVIPILAVFSMPLAWLSGTERSIARRLALTVGSGYYLNQSRLRYDGSVVGSKNSLGWMAAGSYTQPIGRRFRVAGELKWYDAVSAENAAFTAELQLVWRAFSW